MTEHTVLLRFADLQARGIVRNREALRTMQRDYEFPPGFMLTPNARVWRAAEVEAWLAQREAAAGARVAAA